MRENGGIFLAKNNYKASLISKIINITFAMHINSNTIERFFNTAWPSKTDIDYSFDHLTRVDLDKILRLIN